MTWQLASLLIVCAALAAAGFWIERRRPEPRLIALVATLAALAALGRDAFAAVPDVKPITAMVFVCGMALGSGPGFSVGALAALISNMLLGQGPWTPWQMLAWGLVGLCGAAFKRLGAVARRRVAIAAGAAGAAVLFNLVMDTYTFTITGSHTLAAFWLVLASAGVFDVTHVVATFAFAAAFGPALLRILERVSARSSVVWRPVRDPGPLALVAAAALAAGMLATSARGAASRPSPATYLAAAQNKDGGWGAAPGEESSALYTAWSLIALAAAGDPADRVERDGHSGVAALVGESHQLQGAGDIERTILALRANDVDVQSFAGRRLVAELESRQRRDGSTEGLVNGTAFAVLALRSAGLPAGSTRVRRAVRWLAREQSPSGGFSYLGRRGNPDVDDTAAVEQALAAGDGPRPARRQARAFLERAQNHDGGFPQTPGGPSNSQSTAWAVQGLVAAGADARRAARDGGRTAVEYLRSMTTASGAVRYAAGQNVTPVWVTAEALAALAERPFPIRPLAPAPLALRAPPARTASDSRPASRRAEDGTHDEEQSVELLVRAVVEPVTDRISEGV